MGTRIMVNWKDMHKPEFLFITWRYPCWPGPFRRSFPYDVSIWSPTRHCLFPENRPFFLRRSLRRAPSQPMLTLEKTFYLRIIGLLEEKKVPFLVGGGYGFQQITGINRTTKDLDLFIRPSDCPRALKWLSLKG